MKIIKNFIYETFGSLIISYQNFFENLDNVSILYFVGRQANWRTKFCKTLVFFFKDPYKQTNYKFDVYLYHLIYSKLLYSKTSAYFHIFNILFDVAVLTLMIRVSKVTLSRHLLLYFWGLLCWIWTYFC